MSGKPAASYSLWRYRVMAQKCGGCHAKMIANTIQPAALMVPPIAASAISGATAPDTPPTTTAIGERGLSHRV